MAGNVTSESQGFLNFLADDYKQSKAAYLTVLGVLISATLLHKLFSPHNDSREPPLLKPRIPVLGHLIGLLRHQGGYIKIL